MYGSSMINLPFKRGVNMWGKISTLSDSAGSLEENAKDIEWLVDTIEEHVKNARGCAEDAATQVRNMLVDIDEDTEKISVNVEDMRILLQTLEDAESELNEL